MSRNPKTVLKTMEASYAKRRESLSSVELIEFHRAHLILFLQRFRAFISHYRTPSSALLAHDLFLSVEAARNVAVIDLGTVAEGPPWLDLVDKELMAMKAGISKLDSGIERCLVVLKSSPEGK